jgi:hypothetical protein
MATDTDFEATGPAAAGFRTTNQQALQRGVEATGTEIGVHGSGERAGVRGEGVEDGVQGRGERGRGGRFAAGVTAQVNLVPHKMKPPGGSVPTHPEQYREAALPGRAEPGDLWLGTHVDHNAKRPTCTLWLCVDGGGEQPAHWREVLLGAPVPGQI